MMFPVVRSSSYQVFCIVFFKGTEPRGLSGCFQNVEVGRVTPGSDARAGRTSKKLMAAEMAGHACPQDRGLACPAPRPPK